MVCSVVRVFVVLWCRLFDLLGIGLYIVAIVLIVPIVVKWFGLLLLVGRGFGFTDPVLSYSVNSVYFVVSWFVVEPLTCLWSEGCPLSSKTSTIVPPTPT